MTNLQAAITRLVEIVGDYRKGGIPPFDYNHVEKWLSQFDVEVRLDMVTELNHVFAKSYSSQAKIEGIFKHLLNDQKFHGGNPLAYWGSVSLLDIQQGGDSQRQFVKYIRNVAKDIHGLDIMVNAPDAAIYWYLDDGIYSGARVITDLSAWVANHAPANCTVNIAVINNHAYGQYHASKDLAQVIAQSGKNVRLSWLQNASIEDRKAKTNVSDVLRPVAANYPADVVAYIGALAWAPVYRAPGWQGSRGYFSSEIGRTLLEQQFLLKGVYIKKQCPNLKVSHRPLGFTTMPTLGFGTMCITYRNCPNNAPLALWVGHPWYPLFPRSTNADAKLARALENL